MKKWILFSIALLLPFGVVGCSSDEDDNGLDYSWHTANINASGTFIKENTDGSVCVWTDEIPDETFSFLGLSYILFEKTDIPISSYEENERLFFRIVRYRLIKEEGIHYMWGVFPRFLCVVEPVLY